MMRRRTVWAALLLVVLSLLAPGIATPDAHAASMHPKIKQKLEELNASKDWYDIKPGKFLWQIKVGGGWWARFERADLLYRADLGRAYAVHGEIRRKWISIGGPGTAGFPRSDEEKAPIAGRFNRFDDGEIHFISRPTFWIHGAIYRTYRELSLTELRKLGPMESDERGYHGGPGGTVGNNFQHGNVFYSPGYGTSVMHGQAAMAARQAVYLGAGTMTGKPRATGGSVWMRIPFTKASAWYLPGSRTDPGRLVQGALNEYHLKRIDVLGPPAGLNVEAATGCASLVLAKGYLQTLSTGRIVEVSGEMLKQMKRTGSTAVRELGCALGQAATLEDGTLRQRFSGGEATWSPSTRVFRTRWSTYSIVRRDLVPNGGFSIHVGLYDGVGVSGVPPTGRVELRSSAGTLLGTCTAPKDEYGCAVEVPRWTGPRTLTVTHFGDSRYLGHSQEHVVQGWPR